MPITAARDTTNTELFGRRALTYRTFNPSSSLVLPACFFGIEMELEAPASMRNPIDYARRLVEGSRAALRAVEDGSLRNGVELVFADPLLGQEALTAIEQMYDIRRQLSLFGSIRTSTHVHINYTDSADTASVLQRSVLIYLLIEKGLALAAGEHREWNTFCQPTYFAPANFERAFYRIASAGSSNDLLAAWADSGVNETRYNSLNLAALSKYGSLEYRMLGTVEQSQLLTWVNTLLDIKRLALDSTITTEDLLIPTTLEDFLDRYMRSSVPCVVVNDESEIQYETARSRLRRMVGLDRTVPASSEYITRISTLGASTANRPADAIVTNPRAEFGYAPPTEDTPLRVNPHLNRGIDSALTSAAATNPLRTESDRLYRELLDQVANRAIFEPSGDSDDNNV